MDPTTATHSSGDRGISLDDDTYERKESDPIPTQGQSKISIAAYLGVPNRLVVSDTLIFSLLVARGYSLVQGGARPKFDSHRNQLCELCLARLNRTKGKPYSYPPGLICHSCYDELHEENAPKRPASADPSPKPKRVRRETKSDPGETQNLTRLRTRAPRPTTIPAVKKARVQATPTDISALLDQTHARRMALLSAESKVVLSKDA
jgi:hypothetical protein